MSKPYWDQHQNIFIRHIENKGVTYEEARTAIKETIAREGFSAQEVIMVYNLVKPIVDEIMAKEKEGK